MTSLHTLNPGARGGRNKAEDHLLVVISGETWAIATSVLVEIVYLDNLALMPLMPPCVEGVTNLRGVVAPVLNLAALTKAAGTGHATKDIRCVLIQDADMKLALIVDDILRIHSISKGKQIAQETDISRFTVELGEMQVRILDTDLLTSRVRGEIRRELGLRGLLPDHGRTEGKTDE